jgi:uncharacterized protein YgiM (DUF1202 family)
MSKKYLLWLSFSLLFLATVQSFAQSLKLPFKDVNVCPFECCTYREWTVKKNTVLLKQMTDKSATAFRVKKGEKVNGVGGVVITTKAGVGLVLQDIADSSYLPGTQIEKKFTVKKGETVSILTSEGEGFFQIFYKGVFTSRQVDDDTLKMVTEPESVWWVKIKNKKGQIGWTKLVDNFGNKDSCA